MTFTRMEMSVSTEHLAHDSSLEKKCMKIDNFLWKIIALVSFVTSLIAIVLGIVAVDKIGTMPVRITQPIASQKDIQSSCLKLNGSSGIYRIQPESLSLPFQVYCDMDTAGGGWTLVASIHENNIKGKCSPGDKWSSEQGPFSSQGSKNWENRNIFGQIETITDDDYKNPAYYALKASNMMIWHVANQKKAYEISSAATLKYYTDNNFLNKTSMLDLFTNELPLKTAEGGLKPLMDKIKVSSPAITDMIPGWHKYLYDGNIADTSIRDGGGDMYDIGNMIYFATDRENYTKLVYNTPYFLYGSGVEVKSAAIHPFITLAWLGSGMGKTRSNVNYFDIKVVSNFGADGKGASKTYENKKIHRGWMSATYTAFNVANTTDPSICEVYFSISNARWNSVSPRLEKISWTNQTRLAINTVRFNGSPSNVLVGYFLLSKSRGAIVTPVEIESVLSKYMELSEDFTFSVKVPHKIVPVKYAKGNNDLILSGIPTLHRNKVEPGYIQFRPYNSVGLPNALCPGVKVNSDSPERVCIGGGSTAFRDIDQCGDFAGWNGIDGDSGSQSSPSLTGKSQDDINSSILIFIR